MERIDTAFFMHITEQADAKHSRKEDHQRFKQDHEKNDQNLLIRYGKIPTVFIRQAKKQLHAGIGVHVQANRAGSQHKQNRQEK